LLKIRERRKRKKHCVCYTTVTRGSGENMDAVHRTATELSFRVVETEAAGALRGLEEVEITVPEKGKAVGT
jgi:hypothetical protein